MFKPGDIVRISALGIAHKIRQNRLRGKRVSQTGVVIGLVKTQNRCRIKFDNCLDPVSIHEDFIELVEQQEKE